MPQLVTSTVKAHQIKKGDVIPAGTVVGTNAKVKWTLISVAGSDKPVRVEKDSDMVVIREVPTEEEKREKELQYLIRTLDIKEQQARAQLATAREKMIKQLQAGERASSWDWMDVPQAEALVELWDAVTHVHKVRAEVDEYETLTRLEAVRQVMEERTNQALSYYKAISRSSGLLSNMFEDIKLEALSTWRRDLEWVLSTD